MATKRKRPVRDERPHSPPAIDSYEEGLAQVTGWPGAKVRQQPGVYTRVGQRVYFSCTIMLRKQRTK